MNAEDRLSKGNDAINTKFYTKTALISQSKRNSQAVSRRKKPSSRNRVRFNTALNETQSKLFREASEKRGYSPTEFLRYIITQFLDREKATKIVMFTDTPCNLKRLAGEKR